MLKILPAACSSITHIASDESGTPSLPAGHHHDNCPVCRLAESAPALPPPMITLLACSPIVATTTFGLCESPVRAHARPCAITPAKTIPVRLLALLMLLHAAIATDRAAAHSALRSAELELEALTTEITIQVERLKSGSNHHH